MKHSIVDAAPTQPHPQERRSTCACQGHDFLDLLDIDFSGQSDNLPCIAQLIPPATALPVHVCPSSAPRTAGSASGQAGALVSRRWLRAGGPGAGQSQTAGGLQIPPKISADVEPGGGSPPGHKHNLTTAPNTVKEEMALAPRARSPPTHQPKLLVTVVVAVAHDGAGLLLLLLPLLVPVLPFFTMVLIATVHK